MSDPTVAHAQYFTEAIRGELLRMLTDLASALEDLGAASERSIDPAAWGWSVTDALIQHVTYARFLEIQATPPGLVIQNFHLPDTTVLLALFPYPDGHTADEDAT